MDTAAALPHAQAGSRPDARERSSSKQVPGLWALLALSFFMADVQAGLGPFVGVFLQGHQWQPGSIGAVMTIGGIAGLLVTAPAGALIDATTRKRMWVLVCGLFTLLASGLIFVSQNFWVVAASQAATAVAGAAIGPALTGITLGMVGQKGFNRQNGRNQAFNHAGNVAGAALSGYLGWTYGFTAVFWLAAAFGIASALSVLMIPADSIDDCAARGMADGQEQDECAGQPQGMLSLFKNRALLYLAASLACFHLGNAAMLPLYGQAMVATTHADPAAITAITIVVAQGVMIVTSLMAMSFAEKVGYWPVLLVSFLSLPLRGLVAAFAPHSYGVYPVQALDGIGAGLQSVAVPGMVAKLLNGSGRVNVGQGAVMTAQGVGAALSPLLGGALAQWLGYRQSFLMLGALSAVSLVIWFTQRGTLREH